MRSFKTGVETCASILAGIKVTLLELDIAILARKVGRTDTSIRSLARVVTGSSILAGSMVRTEVEV